MSLLVVGSINTDLVIRSAKLPAPGETILGGEFYRAAGGKGANQAVAAARAATNPVVFVGAVGEDDFGREALANFRNENLVCDYLRTVPGQPTGVALILVAQDGQNLISVASGANNHVTPEQIAALPDDVFSQAKVFLTSLEIPLETVAAGLKRAKEAGLRTILNPAPATGDLQQHGILRYVDLLTPNEHEAVALAGLPGAGGDDASQAERAALELRRQGCRAVVVTLGRAGCLVVAQETTRFPAYSVAAVDATAAGDAFNGALAVALAEGKPLPAAVGWAGAAAALSVTRRGALPSLPRRSEIEAFLKSVRAEG